MGSEKDNSWLANMVAAATRGAIQGFKFGPGVLATIVPINLIGIPALAAMVWALRGEPYLAIACLVFGFLFLAYVTERSFRYAEKNPIPALFGGAEILQLLRDQTAAKDRTLVTDEAPIVGASTILIEGEGKRDA